MPWVGIIHLTFAHPFIFFLFVACLQEWLQELKTLAPNAPQDKIEQLLSVAFGMLSKEASTLGMPDFPIDNLPRIAKILVSFITEKFYLIFFHDFFFNRN